MGWCTKAYDTKSTEYSLALTASNPVAEGRAGERGRGEAEDVHIGAMGVAGRGLVLVLLVLVRGGGGVGRVRLTLDGDRGGLD